ncbi:phosphate/phosphite/phosphonate ABC transporter substrate-binding protein [Cupriavidus necator]|uniref:Phosphate/phosphite/phosphonate ABC transporter substrate-binding protein n=1 Tax=Cupriavidus necator TaxID=106590 RepID=A0A367PAG5_CUPNE|nr:phosphate/phosphite/phosphonate ABC transporter substrate-binding protein [Cupriavidus necator]QQX88566.1 phosphate/phosphite/phosphonate ABC transporter substrate-binding protein [Cupriavidus necator]RCJ04858.1 phosphate/phosphite/phosphonate ABC transporter substrate-binding protein [Cupriavidus necator]
MYRRFCIRTITAIALACAGLAGSATVFAQAQHDGSAASPLRVVLIPADGGTEDGTKKDFEPIFGAISQATGLKFDIKIGQSYGAVVEAMCNGAADIAWYGPASYLQARARGCAELLALAVRDGQSVYYSGIFARADAGIERIRDLKGKKIALGDVNSTSSFNVPVAMMLSSGVRPARDAAMISMAGSHANVLKALAEGLVDAGGASFDSFEKAANAKAIDPARIKVVAKSAPIPYPPLAMHPKLSDGVKARLRDAFNNINKLPGITKDQIRGYGGSKVDGYTSKVSETDMAAAGKMFDLVTDQVKTDILMKAGAR